MIAPDVTRTQPPRAADEREMLEGWLEYHRATLLQKCAGLSDAQLKQAACPPSNLTLLGLVRHMAEVERNWFRRGFAREEGAGFIYVTEEHPDADFDQVATADAAADFALFQQELELARQAAAGHQLAETFETRRRGPLSLRWIYVHMIEEYARHNGHADLIREAIDGTTGD
jgi:uncharacterized damage-inducible protein DinB